MRPLPILNRKAFSLVEILVAMLVFSILASIGLVRYRDMKNRAYVASIKADLGELRIAQESHWSEHATYTADQSQLDWRPTTDVTVIITSGDPLVGFDAEATHAAATGITCKMYVGRAVSGTPSGDISCST